MKTVIGIDIGGSTTKIAGFRGGEMLSEPQCVKATDAVTSVYGAFGKFTSTNKIELSDIENVMITGVGSSYITEPIYGLNCTRVREFASIGMGGLYLSGLDRAIVVSMGTGTALNFACRDEDGNIKIKYLGGTGVGGGTLMGLSKKLLGLDTIDSIVTLAESGNLENIDLRIKDMTQKDIIPGVPPTLTASNFGKSIDLADRSDLALGIINMVFESIAMLSVFASRNYNIPDIVLTGNLTTVPQAKEIFKTMNSMLGVNFIIPALSQYGTVVGAALHQYEKGYMTE